MPCRPLFSAAPLSLLLLACQADPQEQPSATASSSPDRSTQGGTLSAAAATTTASTSAPLHKSGPCKGKSAGEKACHQNRLVHCGDKDGAVKVVKSCLSIERCDADKASCLPACPPEAVYVPATGAAGFMMGHNLMKGGAVGGSWKHNKGHFGGTDRPHRVILTKPFCMDIHEVTVREWDECMKKHGCRRPDLEHRFITWPDKLDHPVNGVDWRDGMHFCGLTGKTLPTEAQWEWAATGGDGRIYPWGDEPADCKRADYTPGILDHPAGDAGCHWGGPSKVGAHPLGAKKWPAGEIQDLAGNVWEWCLDSYAAYEPEESTDPLVWKNENFPHVVRGGGWNRSHVGIKAGFRGGARVDYQVPGLGLRCIRNPKEAPVEPPVDKYLGPWGRKREKARREAEEPRAETP